MNDILPPRLRQILMETPELDRAYLVGGCVRDWLLGAPVKDFDVEVFGVDYDSLIRALSRWGRTDLVGRSFGVLKLTVLQGETYDFSLSRRDSKTGTGHRGFAIQLDPSITPQEAASRRDFTINAMMFDLRRSQLLDFYGGESDLKARRLRHTSPAFREDPLRVLRGMQFAARFELQATPETLQICRDMTKTFHELAVERVREEWFKWASRSVRPSLGLRFLFETGWLEHFPELSATVGVLQEPEWHPEGDVWVHTNHCLDALVDLPQWKTADETARIILSLATLLHDVGKARTTVQEVRRGQLRLVSPLHEVVSGDLAQTFLLRIGSFEAINRRVLPLVLNHMAQYDEPTTRAIRRLSSRLHPATVQELVTVMTADASGRPPMPRGIPENVRAILQRAQELELESQAPKPILMGRHLLEHGMKPGPKMGQILQDAFEAQLEGEFQDLVGAWDWLKSHSLKDPHHLGTNKT